MIQKLIRLERGCALIVDETTLQAAGLKEDSALFQMVVNPTGGLTIQSIEAMDGSFAHSDKKASPKEKRDDFTKILNEVLDENDQLMKNLAKR